MTKRQKKCLHTRTAGLDFWDAVRRVHVLQRRCCDCPAIVSLGDSDEAPVAIEIRATALTLGWDGPPPISDEEYRGWRARHDDSITLDSDAKLAGWLSREMCYAGTERDTGTWSWDITRPIADQELEIKAQYNAIGALCDVVKEAGGTMRLYGEPVTESELRAHGEQLVDAQISRICDRLASEDGIDLELIVGAEPEQGKEFAIEGGDDEPPASISDVDLAAVAHAPPREPTARADHDVDATVEVESGIPRLVLPVRTRLEFERAIDRWAAMLLHSSSARRQTP